MYPTINDTRSTRTRHQHVRANAHEMRSTNSPPRAAVVARTQPLRSSPEQNRMHGMRRPHPLMQRTAAWK